MEIPRDWTFKDCDVAQGFDLHVREQLPWYDIMSGAVAHIARHYIPDGGVVYDLGCSTGNIGRLLADTIATRMVDFRPIDNSPEMLNLYDGPGTAVAGDMEQLKLESFDVAIAFLSLMFVPKSTRSAFIAKLRGLCNRGGAIIVVDKEESRGGYLGTAIARLTLAGKIAANAPAAEVLAKELSLAGIQRPICPSEVPDAVRFLQFGEFTGWVMEPK